MKLKKELQYLQNKMHQGGNNMSKRVYRGKCPYESFFEIELEGNCRNCKNFEKCRRLELRRRRRLEHRRKFLLFWGVIIILFVTVILTITLGIMTLITTIRGNIKDETQIPKQTATVIEPMTPEAKIEIKVEISSENLKIQSPESSTEKETQPIPTISAYEAGEIYYYNLSYEEKVYIAKVVYVESRGECFEGQVAVAATVLNRYTSDDNRFCRDSICSVVTQSGQYASIKGITIEDLNTVPNCMEAVEAACKGWDPTRVKFSEGAKFFFNPDGDLNEQARKEREGIETYRIGAHLFHNDFNLV